MKKELLDKEVQYMLENDIIEESQSNWSSPCILVPKHDGGFRFCTDFRKVNDKTKSDSFPIPRIADCIDQIGNAKFVSTFDMLKGYWQVPLTQRAREAEKALQDAQLAAQHEQAQRAEAEAQKARELRLAE